MNIHTYACVYDTYTYMHIYVYRNVNTYECVVYIYISTYTCMYMYMHTPIYTYIYIYAHVCMQMCMCIFVCLFGCGILWRCSQIQRNSSSSAAAPMRMFPKLLKGTWNLMGSSLKGTLAKANPTAIAIQKGTTWESPGRKLLSGSLFLFRSVFPCLPGDLHTPEGPRHSSPGFR